MDEGKKRETRIKQMEKYQEAGERYLREKGEGIPKEYFSGAWKEFAQSHLSQEQRSGFADNSIETVIGRLTGQNKQVRTTLLHSARRHYRDQQERERAEAKDKRVASDIKQADGQAGLTPLAPAAVEHHPAPRH